MDARWARNAVLGAAAVAAVLLILRASRPQGGHADEAPRSAYGTRTIEVAAGRYWTNTGLSLERGETAAIDASGEWAMGPEGFAMHGAAGDGKTPPLRGCAFGSLVGRVGLESSGTLHCVGAGARLVADRGGILFLAPNDGRLEDNRGALRVTIASRGREAPTLAAKELAARDLRRIDSPWVEIVAEHVGLVLPADVVARHKSEAGQAMAAMDEWYGHQRDLAGAVPFGGQRIRYVVDPDLGGTTLMLSGNPIRLDPRMLEGGPGKENLLRVHRVDHSSWGFVHEMGHNFATIHGDFHLIGEGPTEAWANVFTLYTLERMGHPERARDYGAAVAAYLKKPDYARFRGDAWAALGFLMEMRDRYGWDFYKRFFRICGSAGAERPAASAGDGVRWRWVREAFDRAAGEPTGAAFRKYGLPAGEAAR